MKRQKSIGLEESMIRFLERQANVERRSVSSLVDLLLIEAIKTLYGKDMTKEEDKEAA